MDITGRPAWTGGARPGAAPIRHITPDDLRAALREGLADFAAKRGDILFVGLLYPAIGLATAWAALGGTWLYMLFPLAAGLSLLGPLVAAGFYELARRREQHRSASWRHFLDVIHGPSAEAFWTVAALLIGIFLLWLLAAAAIYHAILGPYAPPSVSAFLHTLFATRQGWGLIIVGNLVGLGFALVTLAVSLCSLPMIVDGRAEAGEAIRTSIAAFAENRTMVLRWGAIVAGLLLLGSIPAFLGLAVVLPVLGYATWHLYTRLIDRGALPPR